MLVEWGVAEQRHRAVLEVLDGAAVTVVARRYGVSRQTVHRWLARYAGEGGLANLVDRSSRPGSCPHQMRPATEVRAGPPPLPLPSRVTPTSPSPSAT